ncbi:MAG TPA: NosD domain-containing protein, partial [Methanothrix sp.]|nr:NosD domain-containing protein [Methanothrix sp.]
MKALHALILLLVLSSGQAKTLTVDGKGSGDALNLQDAILLAEDGDSILIMPGNYSGGKADRSLNITGRPGAILRGSLILDAPGCRISHIDIIGPDSSPGISLTSSGCILAGCSISSPANAVYISGEDNRLESCSISSLIGVEILGAKNAVLGSNITAETAVVFNRTRGGMVEGCRISALRGVVLEECNDTSVANNSYSGEGMAIVLSGSYSNLVLGNSLSGEMVSGIDAFQSWGNNFSQNNISGGQVGMSLRGSQRCNLTGNKCRRNER